jgi:hypothetical protein
MQHLEGSGTTVLYIGRTVLKGKQVDLEQILKNTEYEDLVKHKNVVNNSHCVQMLHP